MSGEGSQKKKEEESINSGSKSHKKKDEKNKKFFNKKKGGESHIGKEWDSNDESSSNDEGVTALAFNKSSLSPKLDHTCLEANIE
jgi:hypothetical protein